LILGKNKRLKNFRVRIACAQSLHAAFLEHVACLKLNTFRVGRLFQILPNKK
jgi:hypothetical protein